MLGALCQYLTRIGVTLYPHWLNTALFNGDQPGFEIARFGESGDVILRKSGVIDRTAGSVFECAFDDLCKFLGTNM